VTARRLLPALLVAASGLVLAGGAEARTPSFIGVVSGTAFSATYEVAAEGGKVCVAATKVRNRGEVGVDKLRLKISGTPARHLVNPTRRREDCERDRSFADSVRDAKRIEAKVFDTEGNAIASGRLKVPHDR
jgi:hypothetical protein